MLYLIYGNDWQKARAKAREVLNALKQKRPDSTLVNLSDGELTEGRFEELAESQGLFERKFIIFSDRLCANLSNAEILKEKMQKISKSENVFVFLEGDIKADLLKIFKKYATKIQNFEKTEIKKTFDTFALSDALGEHDKKKLWVLYNKAVRKGIVPEELHGILFWQAKTMRAVFLAKDANEAGLKPFSWVKSKSFLKNWKIDELNNLTSKLMTIYHDAHRGKYELDTALERFILDL